LQKTDHPRKTLAIDRGKDVTSVKLVDSFIFLE